MIVEGRDAKGALRETVDVVIIGSGCGGATAAKHLAEAGLSVVILEQGGYFTAGRGDLDQLSDNMLARIDGGRGLGTSVNGEIALMYGNCVGGASVHYWADSWRLPEDRNALYQSRGVSGHEVEVLAPIFEEIERDHNVHNAAPHYRNRMNEFFIEGATKLGWHVEDVPQARRGCVASGHCYQGCSYDAKQSQLVTYVPAALKAGARLYADCRVIAIERDMKTGRASGVRAVFVDSASGQPTDATLEVKARAVVLAAGGYGSPAVWLQTGLPNGSGQAGKNLFTNPNPYLYALYDEPVYMWQNIPAAVGTSDFRLARYEDGVYREGGYLLHPNQLQPEFLAATLPGFGNSHASLMAELPQIGGAVSWIDDEHGGEVRLNADGLPEYHYKLRGDDILKLRDAMKKQAMLLFASGAREVLVPDIRGTRLRGTDEIGLLDEIDVENGAILFGAPHPAGALRMGDDPATSVVASTHEAHEVPGLYVADPSVFPLPPSVDPSLTIMAFSVVAARHIQNALL
ncbi:GMC family oxidoreductase [Parvibaculum sp.]|uniref:GMC family oxidoreductase N-terminal domain-containing protein n=1 Tax=Parvibaculum sp. TaxID=2024848 RepID=UPI0025F1ED45|nr:GMC family oxidoreductase [Parvibaculum sp.]